MLIWFLWTFHGNASSTWSIIFYQLFLNSQNFKSYSTKIYMSILQQLLYSITKTRKQDYVQDQNLVLQSHLNNSVLFIFECEAIFFSTVHIKLQRQQTANCDLECCCNDCISFHSCLGQNLAILNLKPTFIMTLYHFPLRVHPTHKRCK